MNTPKTSQENRLIELLENLFILEGAKAGMKVEAIRSILKIDKKRVNQITKHIKKDLVQ